MTSASATATLLFTDLVNSTELLQRAGDEQAQRIFRAHHKLLRDAVAANGGHEVKWLGDGLMVAFPSAADAVRCAIAMQQSSRRSVDGERLDIRVGLNAGDALRDESDFFGTPVVVAKRLCDRADAGQILCSDVVAGLLAGRQSFSFRPLGQLDLKGITEPVDTREVVYERDEPGSFLSTTPFVGRGAEVGRLAQKLTDAQSGRGALVMLVGEPGIGKTRTSEEFADRARDTGARVLWGRCYEGEWAPPYGPFVEALEAYAPAADPAELREDLGYGAPTIARLVPALRDGIPDISDPAPLDPEEGRFRLLDAVSQFLIAVSKRAPVVLVLDDLHWADRGTIAMLRHLARFVPRHRMLVLGAYRDVELDRQHPLADALAALRREAEYDKIALKGLRTEDVGTLLSTIAEQEVNAALVQAISDETDGNPFFIREVLAHLVDEGKLYREDGRWTSKASSIAELGIPEGVRQVITRRLSRLSDTSNRFMTAASAFSGGFNFLTIATVTGLDENASLDAVDQALDAQLLRPTGQQDHYEFTHALIRHTLYGEMNPSRQVRLHRQIAEAYEQRNTTQEARERHAAEVAYQYHRSAAMPGAERGVEYALMAADRAEAAAAWDEAVAFLRMADELMPDSDPARTRVLARLGIMLANALEGDEAERVCADAGERILRDEGQDAAATYFADAARYCSTAGFPQPAWRLARRALELLGDRRDDAWAGARFLDIIRMEAEDPLYAGIPLPSAARDELIRVARDLGTEHGNIILGSALAFLPPFRSREDAIAFESTDMTRLSFFDNNLPLFWLGDYTRAAHLHLERMQRAERDGQPSWVMAAASAAARALQCLGRLAEADELIEQARRIAARFTGSSPQLILYLAALDERVYVRGEGWQEHLAANASLATQPGAADRWAAAPIQTAVARVFAMLGAADQAVALIAQVIPAIEKAPAAAANYPRIVCCAVDALWELQRTDHAETLERNLRTKVVEPDFRYVMVDGRRSLAHLCALTGRHEEASDWFARSRAVLDEQGARPLRALVDYDEALMFARRNAHGDPARARPLLDAALAQFQQIGMPGWFRRAQDLRERLVASG